MKGFKVVRKNHIHHGFTYQLGLNIDPLPFQSEGSCVPGGLYFFTNIVHLVYWSNYGEYLYEVDTLDFEFVQDTDKYRSKGLYLSNPIIINNISLEYLQKHITNYNELLELGINLNNPKLVDSILKLDQIPDREVELPLWRCRNNLIYKSVFKTFLEKYPHYLNANTLYSEDLQELVNKFKENPYLEFTKSLIKANIDLISLGYEPDISLLDHALNSRNEYVVNYLCKKHPDKITSHIIHQYSSLLPVAKKHGIAIEGMLYKGKICSVLPQVTAKKHPYIRTYDYSTDGTVGKYEVLKEIDFSNPENMSYTVNFFSNKKYIPPNKLLENTTPHILLVDALNNDRTDVIKYLMKNHFSELCNKKHVSIYPIYRKEYGKKLLKLYIAWGYTHRVFYYAPVETIRLLPYSEGFKLALSGYFTAETIDILLENGYNLDTPEFWKYVVYHNNNEVFKSKITFKNVPKDLKRKVRYRASKANSR